MSMQSVRHGRAWVAGIAVGLALTGCSSDRIAESVAERVVSSAAGEGVDVDIDTSGGTMRVTSDEGEVQIGSASLPEGFPADVPLPDAYDVVHSQRLSNDGRTTYSAMLRVDEGVQDLAARYRDRLPGAGWEISADNETSMGEITSAQLTARSGESELTVVIMDMGEDGTTVQLVVEGG